MNTGDINRNSQHLLRKTEAPGTDHNAHIWILKCGTCGHIYGCNSTDAFQRKCPRCQNGRQGLSIPTEKMGQDWTHDDHIIAFHLYNQIPFGKIDMKTPEVIELAAILGRTPGSVSYKLSNLARLDPVILASGRKGSTHGSKDEATVWEEFAGDREGLAYESARLLAQRLGRPIEDITEISTTDLPPMGKEREAMVQLRVNQSFFRRRVLSAYGFRCCITGLPVRSLLVASHIVPWAEDPENRLNPRNGLCLNSLHDRAFDRGLMVINAQMRVSFSPALYDEAKENPEVCDWLLKHDGRELMLPKNFAPDMALIERHRNRWRKAA